MGKASHLTAALWVLLLGCGGGGELTAPPPPLRPKAIPVAAEKVAAAKDDCEPTDANDEDPAKSFQQRSIPEAEKLAREGQVKLASAESKEVDAEYREQLITEAVGKFTTALLADPYNINATYNLAAAYARIGRVQCSINLLRRMLQMREHPSRQDFVEDKLDRLLGRNKQSLDPDFNDMRDDVRFRTLIERMCERDRDPNCVFGGAAPAR